MTDDILKRLGNQPPYTNEKGQVVEEKPVEEVQEVEEVIEPEVREETPVVSDRTKEQFQKLTSSNQELNAENEKLKQELQELEAKKEEARKFAQNGFESGLDNRLDNRIDNRTPQPYWNQMITNQVPSANQFDGMSQKQVNDVFKSLVDDDGYVNTDLLKDELMKAQRATQIAIAEAQRARQEAQLSRKSFDDFQRNSVAKQVHKEHPALDPDGDKFNPDYYDFVKGEMLNQLMRGEQEDFSKAANKWASKFEKEEPMIKKSESVKKANAAAQINATNPQKGPRGYQTDQADLIKAVRTGKKGALAERLRRSGF